MPELPPRDLPPSTTQPLTYHLHVSPLHLGQVLLGLLRHAFVLLGHAAAHACVCGVVEEGEGIDLLAKQ